MLSENVYKLRTGQATLVGCLAPSSLKWRGLQADGSHAALINQLRQLSLTPSQIAAEHSRSSGQPVAWFDFRLSAASHWDWWVEALRELPHSQGLSLQTGRFESQTDRPLVRGGIVLQPPERTIPHHRRLLALLPSMREHFVTRRCNRRAFLLTSVAGLVWSRAAHQRRRPWPEPLQRRSADSGTSRDQQIVRGQELRRAGSLFLFRQRTSATGRHGGTGIVARGSPEGISGH